MCPDGANCSEDTLLLWCFYSISWMCRDRKENSYLNSSRLYSWYICFFWINVHKCLKTLHFRLKRVPRGKNLLNIQSKLELFMGQKTSKLPSQRCLTWEWHICHLREIHVLHPFSDYIWFRMTLLLFIQHHLESNFFLVWPKTVWIHTSCFY